MNKIIVLAALLAVISLTGCRGKKDSNASKDEITIAYLPISHALPLAELPQRKDIKVKLVKYGSWPELLDALNTGRVDGASILIELAMKARAQGIPLSAYALGHTDGNVIIADKSIRTAKDFKGKSFAIPHRASSHYILLVEALKKVGLKPEDVNIIELTPPEMPSALANHKISGYCVAEPFGAVSVEKGVGKVLYRSEQLWKNSICCALVFNDKAISGKSDKIKLLLKDYQENGRQLENKGKALSVAQKLLSQSAPVLKRSLEWINYDKLSITKESYDSLAAKVKNYGIIANPPSYKEFVK